MFFRKRDFQAVFAVLCDKKHRDLLRPWSGARGVLRPQGAANWILRYSLKKYREKNTAISSGCGVERKSFPACGTQSRRALLLVAVGFDRGALSYAAFSAAGGAAILRPLVVPEKTFALFACSVFSTTALSAVRLHRPQGAPKKFSRLRYPKKPSRCSLARFFRPLRSQPFGFIARRARRTASSYRTAAVCAVKALS